MGKFFNFGSSKNSDDGENDHEDEAETNRPVNGQQASNSRPRSIDDDEHTSLLQEHRGYGGRPPLDPDDPAVTPMNLWSVQFIRFFSMVFLFITGKWSLVLLVSAFVSPPGLHSRGGGWFSFSYAVLAMGILLLLLLSFSVPSKAEQVTLSIIAVLLLVDMIIVVSVPQIRLEEGWPGIASVVWVTVMSIWAVMSDRVVEWGKKEEEQRLTGRPETRRSLKQWCSVFSTTFVMVLFLCLTVLFTATLSLRAHDATLKAPGYKTYVDDHKYQVHLYCTPKHSNDTKESITVLIEGGEDVVAGGLGDWAHDNYVNGTIGRYCYWDRPGMGWSDNAPSPLSAGMASDALSAALVDAGEDGPFILVSHGIGSIYSRIFASRRGSSIKGFLLIDPLHEDYLPNIAAPGRGFLLWARGVISPLGLEAVWGWLFKGRTREDRIYGRSAYLNAKLIKAKLQESLSANSFTKAEIGTANAIMPRDIPLVVVSSGRAVKKSQQWDERQKQMTNITDDLLAWDIVNKAPHNVWEDTEGSAILSKRVGKLLSLALKSSEVDVEK